MSIPNAQRQECLCYQKPTAAPRKIARAWAKRELRNRATVAASMATTMGMLTILLAMLLVGAPEGARAQSSRKDDIVFNAQGRPMAGATVRICTASATGQPCTPLANIYSDPGMTQALANPITTDGLGNYTFYAAPGRYEIEISGPNITTKQLPNVILPSDPSNPTFATVSTTSGISAFSLTLGGNLAVAGNTAITGTLTVGGVPVTGGGGGSPGGSNCNLEYNNSGSFSGASGLCTDTNSLNILGPTPHTDPGAIGARAPRNVSYWANGSCTASSTTATTNYNDASFQTKDGISFYGCGATNTMSTPSTPTVTPSQAAHGTGTGIDVNAPGGSTSYSYKVVALGAWNATPSLNLWGAYTAASAAGTSTTGNALGLQTQTVSTESVVPCTVSACNTTFGGVETITCSSACPVSVGAYVSLYNTSNDGVFSGQPVVLSVSSSTVFTVLTGMNITASGTGGTLAWFNCNHLTTGAVTGAFEYAWYGRTSGTWNFLGFSLSPSFDDFGSTMTANGAEYEWLPPTAPSAAANAALTTTITAGGGSGTLTLATAAINSMTNGFVTFDDEPLFAAAAAYAVNAGGPLFIPCNSEIGGNRYIIGSYFQLASSTRGVNVQQCGALLLDAPMEWDGNLNWFGDASGNDGIAASVGLVDNAQIDVGTAYPGIYSPNATSIFVDHTLLNQYSGSNMALLSYLTNGGPGVIWQNSTWSTGGTNSANDYMGIQLSLGSASAVQPDNTFTNDSWIAGPNQVANASTTPLVLIGDAGQIHFDNCTFNRRGIAEYGATQIQVRKGCWAQGPIAPLVMTSGVNPQIGGTVLEGILMDSSGQPILDVLSNVSAMQGTVEIRSASVDAPYSVVSGAGVANLSLYENGPGGQNQNYSADETAALQPAEGVQSEVGSVSVHSQPIIEAQPGGNIGIQQLLPAPTASLSSGGTLSTSASYVLFAIGCAPSGCTAATSGSNSLTPTSGNQTIVAVLPSAIPGASSYDWYYMGNGGGGYLNACKGVTGLTCTWNGAGGVWSSNSPPSTPTLLCPGLTPNASITCDGPVYATVPPTPITDSSTVSLAVNPNKGNPWYTLALTGNTTLNVSGMVPGQQIKLFVTQPASGGPYTVALGTGCVWQGQPGGAIAWSTAPSVTDLLSWWYDGTNCWAVEGPLNGPPLQTYYMTPGYAGNTLAATANATVCSGFVIPAGGVSAGHVWLNLSANDNTNNSDFGIYNSTGTLLAHIGAQHTASTGGEKIAFTGGTTTFLAGKSYACLTSAGSTIALQEISNSPSFYNSASVGSTTSGGALNGSITPPADGFSSGNQWEFMLVP